MKPKLWILLLALLPPAAAHGAQEKPAAPGLILEAVRVDPSSPGPDTLCRLSVTVRNPSAPGAAGARTASALGFRVAVDGRELPVYRNELFFRPVPPGGATEIRLHNFWSSETGRPFPTNGRMTVEVTLTEAQWMRVQTENGAEIWTAAAPVEGLPVSKSVTLAVRPSAPR